MRGRRAGRRRVQACVAVHGHRPRGPQRQTGHLPRHAPAGRSVGQSILPSPPGGCVRSGRAEARQTRTSRPNRASQPAESRERTCLSPSRATQQSVRSVTVAVTGPAPGDRTAGGGARTVAAGAPCSAAARAGNRLNAPAPGARRSAVPCWVARRFHAHMLADCGRPRRFGVGLFSLVVVATEPPVRLPHTVHVSPPVAGSILILQCTVTMEYYTSAAAC